MKILYKLVLFFMLWNISLVLVASTTFFGTDVFYGDLFKQDTITGDPDATMDSFTGNPKVLNQALNFLGIIGLCTGAGIVVFIIGGNISVLALAIVGGVILHMFTVSRGLIDKILNQIAPGHNAALMYVGIMIVIGILFLFMMEVIDIASGQRNTE